MNTKPGTTAPDLIAALMWGPKTAAELIEITGSHFTVVHGWLTAFKEAGVIRKTGGKGTPWALCRRPFSDDHVEAVQR